MHPFRDSMAGSGRTRGGGVYLHLSARRRAGGSWRPAQPTDSEITKSPRGGGGYSPATGPNSVKAPRRGKAVQAGLVAIPFHAVVSCRWWPPKV